MSDYRYMDEQYIKTLFNSMDEGFAHHEIMLDEKGKPYNYRFLEINNSFESITGLKREYLLGRTVSEVIPGIEQFWIDTYGRVALTGKSESYEQYQKTLDKHFKVIAFSNKIGEFSVLFIDVTEIKKAHETEYKYKLLLEKSNDIILFFNQDLNVIDANQMAISTYGYTKEELLGKNIKSIRSAETHAKIPAQIQKAIQEGVTFETVHVKKDGICFPVEVSSKGINLNGNLVIMNIIRDISQRWKTEQELYRLANFDYLTEIPNRGFMIYNFEKLAGLAERAGTKIAMLFFDIDKFKFINDNYGHDAGDQVLKEIASRVMKITRKSDLLARIGGDEFIILQSEVKCVSDIKRLIDKVLTAFKKPIIIHDININVTTSIGIAVFPDDSKDRNELMTFSDRAMYQAKQEKGNSYLFYSQLNSK